VPKPSSIRSDVSIELRTCDELQRCPRSPSRIKVGVIDVLSVSRPLQRCELDSRQLKTVADRKSEV